MKYVEFINELIAREAEKHDQIVLFGQNINAGSFVGGFTKELRVKPTGRIFNSTNSENSLCGFGFGLMMQGARAIFFMKQLDFLLLGIDQLVNTYNIIRNMPGKPTGSFTIMPIVVDNGYQGPQSSLNNFADFCSLGRIPGFTITNKLDAELIIRSNMVSPGFRIIAVSQRLFKEELIIPNKPVYCDNNLTLFQYAAGKNATIICFNFSFPQGLAIHNALKKAGINTSLFNVNSPTPINWSKVIADAKKTEKLLILDDSKSQNLSCHSLLSDAETKVRLKKKLVLVKKFDGEWLIPNADQLEINIRSIIRRLQL